MLLLYENCSYVSVNTIHSIGIKSLFVKVIKEEGDEVNDKLIDQLLGYYIQVLCFLLPQGPLLFFVNISCRCFIFCLLHIGPVQIRFIVCIFNRMLEAHSLLFIEFVLGVGRCFPFRCR